MARKRNDDETPLSDDELRELLLSLTVEGGNTRENRTRVYTALIHSGIREREAQVILNSPNEVLRSLGRGAEGAPNLQLTRSIFADEPEDEGPVDHESHGPVLDIIEDRMGIDPDHPRGELAMRRGPIGLRSSSKRVTGDDDDFTPEELLRGLDNPDDVNQYIWANSPNWTTEEAEGVRDFLEENGGATGQYAGSYNQLFLDHDDLMSGNFDGEPVGRDGAGDDDGDGYEFNPEDIQGLSPDEFIEFVEDHAGDFTEGDIQNLQAHTSGLSTANTDWNKAAIVVQTLAVEGPEAAQSAIDEQQSEAATRENAEAATIAEEERAAALEAAASEAARVWGRTDPGVKPDMSSVEELVPDDLSPVERDRFLSQATEQGRAQAVEARAGEIQGETGASDDEARQVAERSIGSMDLFNTTEPDWLLQMNQGALSEQQKDRYVDYWNDAYGTFIRDFDTELAPILARYDGTETEVQNFAAAVLAAQEPLITQAITLPLVQGERKASYTEDEMKDLRAMGFSNDAITRLVRLSAITAGEDSIRPGAAGDTLNVAPLAALVRYYGGGKEFANFTQTQQDMADIERSVGLRPGQFSKMTFKQRQEYRAQLEAQSYQSPTMSVGTDIIDRFDKLEGMARGMGMREEKGTLPGILAANNNFKRGLEAYRGDQLLAIVHAVDPALARTVASTGGDPDKLDWQSNAAVFNILEQAGVIEGSNVRLRQLESATGFFGYFNTGRGAGAGGGGGAGKIRRLVDPVATQQAVQQLWSRMFLSNVSDATVQAITADLQRQLDEAPEGMSFDVSARIEAFLKGQDIYNELYRNKPEGLSEEEYQAQFAAGVGDMLGAELDPEALKAGMRSGDYQTAVGRAASSKKLLTNSTLRGRWAQAKQTLDRFT